MPLNRVPLTGNQIVAMANVSREEKTSFTSTGTFDYSELNVLGLPSLLYWVRLDSPVANVRFYPLFAVTNITTAGVPVPNWAPFNNGTILVPGNHTVFTIRAAVSTIGIRIVLDPPLAPLLPISVTTILTAGG
jgi:hypothetical protein